MTCEEAHTFIKPFLKHSLSVADTLKMIRHIERCGECSAEVEVSYMIDVMSGIDRGEDLPTYDLKRLFREKLLSEKKKCRRKVLLSAAVLLIAMASLTLFLIYRL